MKIRVISPTGCVTQVEIEAPEKPLQAWQLNSYVRKELNKRNIEFKKFVVL